MNKYESVIIINPAVDEERLNALTTKFTEMINKDDAIEIRICNAEHDEYADNYDLILITNRDVDPASLCTKGEFIKKTTSRLWISKTRYYIEAGTWTQEFLDALAYNLGVCDEKEVYEALSKSDWSSM